MLLRLFVIGFRLRSIGPNEGHEHKPEMVFDILKAKADCFGPTKLRPRDHTTD